ncbi:DGQHR domain protein [Acinetobacter sp. 983759]|uniref:DGQHR domain-containing protein n=1 Tax=Acinetobacter sp. 983759 TaxID=1310660 RepID=UPI00044C9DB8|nr:DGQHR domain-containing protein [Acinetobacter sp. 983759]EXE15298.1 DGQHR domain protein [Acinetobacter sp. 983759]
MSIHSTEQTDFIEVPCLELIQHSSKLYQFNLDAISLWNILKINERVADKDEGYQRALSNTRAEDLKKFINNKGIVSPALIVSLENATYDQSKNTLKIPNIENAGWVIDGQHRLRGAYLSATQKDAPVTIELPVVAFLNLNEDEQIIQFVTINKEAKGVPTSLYYDLLNRLPPKKTSADQAKEIAVEVARTLTKDSESVFYDRIIFARSPKKGEISLNNFVRKISPLLTENKGTLGTNFSQLEKVKILNNYFSALKIVFPEQFTSKNQRFMSTLGFGAAINTFDTVFSLTRSEFGTFRTDDIVKVLTRIEDYNFTHWDQYGTGVAAENAVGSDFRTVLVSRTQEVTSEEGILKL